MGGDVRLFIPPSDLPLLRYACVDVRGGRVGGEGGWGMTFASCMSCVFIYTFFFVFFRTDGLGAGVGGLYMLDVMSPHVL